MSAEPAIRRELPCVLEEYDQPSAAATGAPHRLTGLVDLPPALPAHDTVLLPK